MHTRFHKDHVLAVGDLHLPFAHKHYLDFCKQVQNRVKCGTVIFLGDLCDSHAISFHEHDPDGSSPADEMKLADKELLKWKKAFPGTKDNPVRICLGNHDRLPDRRRRFVGLPERCFNPFRKIWDFPDTWQDDFSWCIDGVRYMHGTGASGENPHVVAANKNRQSTVIGHVHSVSATKYLVSENDRIMAMAVGCGVDRRTYAFAYGRDFLAKPVLSCGVVTDHGTLCQLFPMEL